MKLDADNIGLIAAAVVGLALLFGLPLVVELFTLLQFTVYIVMAILALSLALIWGFGGILCFGQAVFFGLGAYSYTIAVFNIGESTVPVLLSIVVPAAFAAALGYFMFYGRLSDVYMGVVTLVVTLIFFSFMNHTAGEEYRIGASRLGGFNGIPAIPPINMPGDPGRVLWPEEMYYVAMGSLTAIYLGLRLLLRSHFGRVIVAIRENETRAELLGYDVRLHKLLIFSIGGAIAGLAGCLFANWNAFVDPTVFGLGQTAQIIIWVIVGGLGTLIGPVIGAMLLQYITTWLGTVEVANSSLVMGAILVVFVLLVPRGLVPTLQLLWQKLRGGQSESGIVATPREAVESGDD
ncbi:MAG: hypothetical protein MI806_25075 [Minwuiales bacterium]|nr:hypothetical protein [Minwuiales bacterium]